MSKFANAHWLNPPKVLVQKQNTQLSERKISPFRVAAGFALLTLYSLNPNMASKAHGQDLNPNTTTKGKPVAALTASKTQQDKTQGELKLAALATKTAAVASDGSSTKETKQASTKQNIQLAQNDTHSDAAYETNAVDIAGLPQVALKDMNALLKQSKAYELLRVIDTVKTNGKDFCYEDMRIPIPGTDWGVVPTLVIGIDNEQRAHNEIGIRYPDLSGMQTDGAYALDEFASVYKFATGGRTLKWAKLIGDPVQDSKEGTYVNVYLVPLSSPNASIETGTVAMAITYADGRVQRPGLFLIK
jgi:hypothetical protein